MRFGAVPVRFPFVGWLSTTNVSGSLLASLPLRVIDLARSGGNSTDCGLATGGSLMTLMLTVAVADTVFSLSVTVKVKLSAPR